MQNAKDRRFKPNYGDGQGEKQITKGTDNGPSLGIRWSNNRLANTATSHPLPSLKFFAGSPGVPGKCRCTENKQYCRRLQFVYARFNCWICAVYEWKQYRSRMCFGVARDHKIPWSLPLVTLSLQGSPRIIHPKVSVLFQAKGSSSTCLLGVNKQRCWCPTNYIFKGLVCLYVSVR